MRYKVVVTDNAKQNLREYYLRASESAPETAAIWLDRFYESLKSLGLHPERCQLAPENNSVVPVIRQYLFGKRAGCYRVLFTVDGEEVQILHVRRAARSLATEEDLFDR
ncbi:MAG: type II toxin-antitoxin system RelE/ParE family toxin [Planctomycetota bacterium]